MPPPRIEPASGEPGRAAARQDVAEEGPRSGEARQALLARAGVDRARFGGSGDGVLGCARALCRRRSVARQGRARTVCTRDAHAAANRSYSARAAGSSADDWNPPVGRSEAKMPTASGPRSPAKSGSHSAIVEPMSAPTCRSGGEHRSAEGDAIRDVGGQDDQRLVDAVLSWVMTPGPIGDRLGRTSPGRRSGVLRGQAAGWPLRRRPSERSRRRRRRSRPEAAPASWPVETPARIAANVAELEPRLAPARADAEDERKAPAGQLVGDRSGFPVHESRRRWQPGWRGSTTPTNTPR